jgi:hypothetical protein
MFTLMLSESAVAYFYTPRDNLHPSPPLSRRCSILKLLHTVSSTLPRLRNHPLRNGEEQHGEVVLVKPKAFQAMAETIKGGCLRVQTFRVA